MIHAMAALRMSIPVAVVRRSFSSTSKMMANVRKRPAFVKRKAGIGAAKEAAGIVHPGVRQTLAGKDQVLHNMEPSGRRSVITIWNATNKSSEESTIDISGERQFDFLSRFQQLDSEGGSLEDKKRLCAELRIIPSDLHGMATISLKDAPQFKELSCTILRLSADIGHAPSLCELVARSFTDRSPVSGVDLQKLKELTNSQTPDGRLAMSIMGVYHASRKQYGDAMRMLTGATEVESEIRITATAYFNMALIQLIQKDWESAMKALRKAAEAGETRAKYWLATQAEDGTPLQIATYEGAAATGMTEACHNLGHAELTKSSRQPGRPRLLRDYGMAREWFEAAAANDFVPSILNLALMCKAVGEMEAGLAWLNHAQSLIENSTAQSPGIQHLVQNMRSRWDDKTMGIKDTNSGYWGKIDPIAVFASVNNSHVWRV